MRKSILLIFLALFCSVNISGCSLFSSDDEDQETATVAEEDGDFTEGAETGDEDEFASDDFESGDDGDFDAEAMAKDEGDEELDDLAGEDVEVEDTFGDDEYPDDDYAGPGDAVAKNDDSEDDYIDDNSFASDEDLESDDSLFVDEGGGIPTDTMASNEDTDLFGGEEPDPEPVIDTPVYDDSSFDSGMASNSFLDEEPKNYVPVKRMKPAAYKRAGGNVNRLYVVRSGDNMDSIAEKLYGSASRSEDLYNYNSHFRGKTLNVGDKVYYESPNSPNDQSMMTYYEDNNVAPQYYTSQDGDNIRRVAKKLLGHERSWMEVYATNENVPTKDQIPGGLQIRYWPDGSAPAPTMAMNEPEPEPEMMEPEPAPAPPPEPEPVAMDEPADVPDFDDPDPADLDEPQEVAQVDPPPANPGAMGNEDDDFNPPPAAGQVNPPPVKPIAPPPPPPAPKANVFNKPKPPKFGGGPKKNVANDPLASIGDDSTVMAALGGLLILAAAIMLIFIRRSRAKRVNFSQTQV